MYQLAIGNTVEFKTTLKLQNAGVVKTFTMDLIAERISAEDLMKRMSGFGKEELPEMVAEMRQILRDQVTGWRNQRLVLDADGEPAEFSTQGLDMVMDIPGVVATITRAYQEAISESSGDTGRRKNSGG